MHSGPLSALCLSCGLCCDGTMFAATELGPGDPVDTLRTLGAHIVTVDDTALMRQPCPAHNGGCCTVYANRPSLCRQYRCALLQQVDTGTITAADAHRIITWAVTLRDRVRHTLAALYPGPVADDLATVLGDVRRHLRRQPGPEDPAATSTLSDSEALLDALYSQFGLRGPAD